MPPPLISFPTIIIMEKIDTTIPSFDDEKVLDSILDNSEDEIAVRGKKWKMRWVRFSARRKITNIMLNEEEGPKAICKCVAALRCNGFFKMKFMYWILWRWYYYVKEYSESELLPYVQMCKKKVLLPEYYVVTTYLIEMRDTIMAQTTKEVNRTLQEHLLERQIQSRKSTQK